MGDLLLSRYPLTSPVSVPHSAVIQHEPDEDIPSRKLLEFVSSGFLLFSRVTHHGKANDRL